MDLNNPLNQGGEVQQAVAPVDINGNAQSSRQYDMSYVERLCVLVMLGAVGATFNVRLRQATGSDDGGEKNLDIPADRIYKSADANSAPVADDTDLASGVLAVPADADNSVYCIEVLQGDLDSDNDFSHVSIDLTDPGAATVVGVVVVAAKSATSHNTGKPSIAEDDPA